jgi:hypothetical protein
MEKPSGSGVGVVGAVAAGAGVVSPAAGVASAGAGVALAGAAVVSAGFVSGAGCCWADATGAAATASRNVSVTTRLRAGRADMDPLRLAWMPLRLALER